MTQDIISALGQFSELTVMSCNAVSPFKGKPASPGEIAHSLRWRYQVEGRSPRRRPRRVTAQLVNTDGEVLWSARFDEALADLFVLQDKITAQIAGAMAIHVSQAEQRRVFAKPTESLEAYDYVLRARPALLHPTRINLVQAVLSSGARSSSTRIMPPPTPRSLKPIMAPCRWAGRSHRWSS